MPGTHDYDEKKHKERVKKLKAKTSKMRLKIAADDNIVNLPPLNKMRKTDSQGRIIFDDDESKTMKQISNTHKQVDQSNMKGLQSDFNKGKYKKLAKKKNEEAKFINKNTTIGK